MRRIGLLTWIAIEIGLCLACALLVLLGVAALVAWLGGAEVAPIVLAGAPAFVRPIPPPFQTDGRRHDRIVVRRIEELIAAGSWRGRAILHPLQDAYQTALNVCGAILSAGARRVGPGVVAALVAGRKIEEGEDGRLVVLP